MKEEYSVSKANKLVCGNKNTLSALQQKLILTLASLVQPNDDHFKLYDLRIKDFQSLCKNKSIKYSEIIKITRDIMREVIELENDEGNLLQCHWIESAIHIKKKGIIKIKLSDQLMPYLLDLKGLFLKYKLENILQMKSKYSIKIYELLKNQIYKIEKYKKNTYEISLTDLKKYLDADLKSYKSYNNFKVKVLEMAEKELRLYSDVNFEIVEIKTGKKVTSIRFILDDKSYERSAAGEEFQQLAAELDPEDIFKDPVEDEVKEDPGEDPVEDEVKDFNLKDQLKKNGLR